MTWSGGAPLVETFAVLREALRDVMAVPVAQFSRSEAMVAVEEFCALGNVVEAARLHLLRIAAATARSQGDVVDFLVTALRNVDRAQAARDVTAARTTDPGVEWDGRVGGTEGDRGVLQLTGAALAAGATSRAHLDVAVRAVTSIPTSLRRGTAVVVTDDGDGVETARPVPRVRLIDGYLASQAGRHAPSATKVLTEELLAVLDPDRVDRGVDPDAHARRGLRWARRLGAWTLTVDVDEASHLELKQAIAAFSAPDPTVDGIDGTPVPDPRSAEQRRCDGLLEVVRRGVSVSSAAVRESATVLVHVGAGELVGVESSVPPSSLASAGPVVDGHGPVAGRTLSSLACDGRLRSILLSADGAVLSAGSAGRLATREQREALTARDGGCVAPGCPVPAWTCEAHHVRFWRDGGPTTVRNMALLCPRHHRALHAGHLQVRIVERGLPEARWTTWSSRWPGRQDAGPWVRNTFPEDLRGARTLARRLTDSRGGLTPRSAVARGPAPPEDPGAGEVVRRGLGPPGHPAGPVVHGPARQAGPPPPP